jgi:phenylacetate-CoA ligase
MAMKQLYLSANHVSPRNTQSYLVAMNQYRITHLVGYSFSAAALAREALDRGFEVPGLKLVITIAEALLPWQRDALRKGFKCEVRESYGMAELVAAAAECQAGSLHLWPEVGWLEVFDDKENVPVPCGTTGRLIATGLMNLAMPLIRYEIGDRGTLGLSGDRCSCGRLLPMLASVEGRMDDVLYTQDGRWLGRLDPVFKANLPIREAQIIQETLDRIRIRYVPTQNFTAESSQVIIERLQARMGPVNVIMEPVEKVPRGANGKFKPVINMMNSSPMERR